MLALLKEIIRKTLIWLHLDFTRNLRYDRLSLAVMKRAITPGSNCLDIGCHRGEMMDVMLRLSPDGHHIGFEPIPELFENLRKKYDKKVEIWPYALCNHSGTSRFNHVKNAEAYSGLKERKYNTAQPDIQIIEVQTRRLDEVIPASMEVHFIKIDVEGGEFAVLQGGVETLKRCKPVVLFECGLGASDYYGTDPLVLFRFLRDEAGFGINTLPRFLNGKETLTEEEFFNLYSSNRDYYFIALPIDARV